MIIQVPFRDPKKYPITQLFGERFLYRGEIASHKGVDWAIPKFTPLLAPFSGKVYRVEKTRDYGYGRTVYIVADDKKLGRVECLLAHCESVVVEVGYNIKMGNNIAYSGNSGFWVGRTGYHLHFGLIINGKYVDPLLYLKMAVDSPQQDLFKKSVDQSVLKSFLGDYVVKKDDNLWKISEKYYGHGGHYVVIFNANQDILKNPNIIQPGQRLRIPALVDKGL